jgi:CubicO group peptidase (beta-lactamase class C family)
MNMKVHTHKGFVLPSMPLVMVTLVLVVVAGAVFLWQARKPSGTEVPAPDYWPTTGWRTAVLEAHGFDSAITAHGLRSLREDGTRIHSLLMVRGGEVILDAYFYPYDGSTLHDVASVTKSVTTTLIAIAADQGKLDLDAPMLSFFPDRTIANLEARKERITVRHLASMSSGLECYHQPSEPTNRAMQAAPDWIQFTLDLPMAHEPGTQFAYCSPGMHLLSAILQQATGMSALEFARLNLFEPLGIHESEWSADPQGINNGGGDLFLYPRDMAKLGFLWLHDGEWEGQQIVPREWVRLSSQRQIETGENYGEDYGYGWWIARPGEDPIYAADGRGGQRIVVFPAMNLVIVTTGGGFVFDDAGKYLVEAIGEADPLPANPEGVADLQAALAEVLQPPTSQPVPPLPEMARTISGNTYLFKDNSYRLASLRMDFSQKAPGPDRPTEATLDLTFHGNLGDWSCIVGLDGRYRFTKVSDEQGREFILGMRGAWIDAQTFVLEQNEIASPNAMELRVRFDSDHVTLEGPGLDGAGTISLEGWQ